MTDKNVVVCVDDDPTLLNAIARALRPTGFDVRPTLSPTQALDWISSENVAVVIADYEMPEMSGARRSRWAAARARWH